MDLADGNVSRLVFRYQISLVAIGYLGGAADNNPMFSTVVVHLYRQLGTRRYSDALDLVAMTVVDRVVHSPWAIHLTMVNVLVARAILQLLDYLFYILHAVLVRDQNSILGFYYY
ncbi:hypothetical protein D3C76_1536920 [compost metagenome]